MSELPADFPSGWYATAYSNEIGAGEVKTLKIFGQEMVLFRTESGQPALVEAYCPHLGAHLGHGGKIQGEVIRCPFHGFCFDRTGDCVSTPYNKRLPKGRLRSWPILEQDFAIFTWFDAQGRAPFFEIPKLNWDDNWTEPYTHLWPELRSHPQETTENSVDLGHLSEVHGYEKVQIVKKLNVDGTYLNATYRMQRKNPWGSGRVKTEFNVHVHGLGYSMVEVEVFDRGMSTRQYVFPIPIDHEHISLRIGIALQVRSPMKVSTPLGLMPSAWAKNIIGRTAIAEFAKDVSQDFDIWRHKKYVMPPSLAEGDGPIGPYRKWCKQFYPNHPAPKKKLVAIK